MSNQRLAAVWHAAQDLRIEHLPVQDLGPWDVRVSVTASGVCGSDVHLFYDGLPPHMDVDPFALGHETAGVITEVGAEVSHVKVGDHVAIEPGVPCGRCEQCRLGFYNLCPNVQFFADPPTDGTFAEQVVVDARFVYPYAPTVPDEIAALAEPLSCVLAAARRADVTAGSRVLITGAGSIGQLAVRAVRSLGAAHVAVSDVNPVKLELAGRGGADQVIDARHSQLEGAVTADVLIECSGVGAVATNAIASLAPRGRAVLIGMGLGDNLAVPVAAIQDREVTVTGAFRFANTFGAAVNMIQRLDVADLITHRYPLAQTEQALRALREDPSCVKAMVLPQLAS